MDPYFLLLLNAAAALYMTGVIWVIQLVHYPLFADVPGEHFPAYAKKHVDRMGAVVGPVMLLELAVITALFFQPSLDLPPGWLLQNAILLGVIWFKTFACSVPCHRRLARGFDAPTHRRLVLTNGLRTAAWTLRAALAITALWITR